MKLELVGDTHLSAYSSILRKRGNMYSVRLEGIIKSVEWAESIASQIQCPIIYLGDFFDRAELKSEELSALSDIKWSNVSKKFIVGNHEIGKADAIFSSVNVLKLNSSNEVISIPSYVITPTNELICMLPYTFNILEDVIDYWPSLKDKWYTFSKRILFMHNDIKGVQMGKFMSTHGLDKVNLDERFDLVVNGHLHNQSKVSDKIINIGNLTGQNFSEDASKYPHQVMILDTETLSYELVDNPYAFNFYSCVWPNVPHNIKPNSVVTLKVAEDKVEEANNWLASDNIIQSMLLVNREIMKEEVVTKNLQSLQLDHIKEFREFILANTVDSEKDSVREELEAVLGQEGVKL